MILTIDSNYQLVFGEGYFFYYNIEEGDKRQMIKSFTKELITSATVQEDNRYSVYNFITGRLMFQGGDKGPNTLTIAFREDYENKDYQIPIEGMDEQGLANLKECFQNWMTDQINL